MSDIKKYKNYKFFPLLFFSFILTNVNGCTPVQANTDINRIENVTEPSALQVNQITVETQIPTETIQPDIEATDSAVKIKPTHKATKIFWQDMPVIPVISDRAIQIYKDGLEKGNNPHSFSKIGDCESRTTWFFADFDSGDQYYSLGDYEDLQPVIDYFQGSFGRLSLVAKPGFNAASVMVPIWSDKDLCEKNETPLACEYRINKPSIAFIMLGTNDVYQIDTFEDNLKRILDYTIQSGVVPILSTKADNLEGDHYINSVIVRLANDYDIPLWNFWAAVQFLPDHGLQEDKAHLTWGPNRFEDPLNMERAWPVRNLTALQALQAAWNEFAKLNKE